MNALCVTKFCDFLENWYFVVLLLKVTSGAIVT